MTDKTERADFDWFVNQMETKQKDTMNFLDSMNLVRDKKQSKKLTLNSWDTFTQ